MITVTEQALAEVRALLQSAQAAPGQGVRFARDGNNGLTFSIAAPGDGDTVIVRDGAPLLSIERGLAELMEGMVLDYRTIIVAGESRTRFTFRC